MKDFSPVLYQAIYAARLGREVLLKYMGKLEHVEHKFQAGLVSEADKESEKTIFDNLRKNFPDDIFMGEESYFENSTKVQEVPQKGQGRWIVDPLDGTTNYIHQFPVFCVSIGYEVDGKVQVAVIDVPMMGQVYSAVRGKGAWVNGKPLKVSNTEKLSDAFVATGFFNQVEPNLVEQLRVFGKLVREVRDVRRAGAAAYDLCLVAQGVFDGYWEKGLKPWDSAAGLLLVEEAGGKVVTYKGNTYNPFKNSIIAGNEKVVSLLMESMKSVIDPESD
jgi:myo-inositol-1(or 4)-monophosphatase